MNYDEFAFVNQQLAGMLRSGIPLEGALRQLSTTMRRGTLKTEFERLEADLKQGTPLATALAARRLPEFYVAMIRVGVQGNDLPAVLTLLADYYQKQNTILSRLKGLMVYPAIVLVVAFGLSLVLSLIMSSVLHEVVFYDQGLRDMVPSGWGGLPFNQATLITLWLAPAVLALAAGGVCAGLAVPRWRRHLRWRLPGFKEASLAQIASSLALMLERGTHLDAAIELLRACEGDSPAGRELAQWHTRLAQGEGKAAAFAAGGRVFPPLFVWLADNAGENLAIGFGRAASIYQSRAMFRIEMMLYACLPVSVLLLGIMIVGQVYPVLEVFRSSVQCLSGSY